MTQNQPMQGMDKRKIRALLVDDQAMIGEAVRRMLADDPEIELHFCQDPAKAIPTALEIKPTVILQDLVMPDIDGLTLVKFFRANPNTSRIPMIVLSSKEEPTVKAEAFALGANDYLVKLPDKIELIARIRYHSDSYIHLLERDEAYEALKSSREELQAELNEAADYVFSLLPHRLPSTDARGVAADWKFVPSTSLGGDSFGYHWTDDDHFALYLLDVCGHGVGAALLSVSAMNALRSQTLPNADFLDPGDVLTKLNEAFQMENQNNMYFTMWYGVYQRSAGILKYSSGGHPPAVLKTKEGVELLKFPGMVIGGMPGMTYQTKQIQIEPENQLFLFSDGVYELTKKDSQDLLTFEEYVDILCETGVDEFPDVGRIYDRMREINAEDRFDDDFSLAQFHFQR